jgi:hypothetical protein
MRRRIHVREEEDTCSSELSNASSEVAHDDSHEYHITTCMYPPPQMT